MIDDSDAPHDDDLDVPARAPLRALPLLPLLKEEEQRNMAALAAAFARSRRRRILLIES